MTPKSDLGINSPTFDSRSEVSRASRLPVAPESPRIDPLNLIEEAQAVETLGTEPVVSSGNTPDIIKNSNPRSIEILVTPSEEDSVSPTPENSAKSILSEAGLHGSSEEASGIQASDKSFEHHANAEPESSVPQDAAKDADLNSRNQVWDYFILEMV